MRTVAHGSVWFKPEDKHRVIELMCWQSSAVRSAYQAIHKHGLKNNDVKIYVKRNYMQRLNQRYIADACSRAKSINQEHAVFGGKRLWKKLQTGTVSKQQWLEQRNNQLYSRGDKTKAGNPNIRVLGNKLMVNDPQGRGLWIIGNLYIPKKFDINTECYDVKLLYVKGQFQVQVGYEIQEPEQLELVPGAIGVDVNPSVLGIAEVDSCGNLLKHFNLKNQKLQHARQEKRNTEIYLLAKQVVDYAIEKRKQIVVEDLNFNKKKNNRGKKFRRMSHNFIYSKLLTAIERRAVKCGVLLKRAHPAFTSELGLLKYKDLYSLNRHTSAAMVIARRGLGLLERATFTVQEVADDYGYLHLEGKWYTYRVSVKAWSWMQQFIKQADLTGPRLTSYSSESIRLSAGGIPAG